MRCLPVLNSGCCGKVCGSYGVQIYKKLLCSCCRCEWDQKHGNSPLLLEYTHLITITGTNSYGTSLWHEEVNPAEHVHPGPVKNLTVVPSNHTPSCFLEWEAPLSNENFLRTVGLVYQIDTKEDNQDPDDADFSGVDVWDVSWPRFCLSRNQVRSNLNR